VVICLERGADLHTAQLMPLSLTVSRFSKIQIGFTFLVLAHQGNPGQRAIKRVCMCVFVCVISTVVFILSRNVRVFNCFVTLCILPSSLLLCRCREIVTGVTQLFEAPALGIFSAGQKTEGIRDFFI